MDVMLTAAIQWTAERVKRLRGKRTKEEFGRLGSSAEEYTMAVGSRIRQTGCRTSRAAFRLAKKEKFLQDRKLEGSAELLGDLEEGSKILREMFELSWRRGLDKGRSSRGNLRH